MEIKKEPDIPSAGNFLAFVAWLQKQQQTKNGSTCKKTYKTSCQSTLIDCKTMYEKYRLLMPVMFSECGGFEKPEVSNDDFLHFFRQLVAQQSAQHNFPFGITAEQQEKTLFYFWTMIHVYFC